MIPRACADDFINGHPDDGCVTEAGRTMSAEFSPRGVADSA
jgi:hypothetical protein